MKAFFTVILFQPLFNALVFFYVFIPGSDFVFAVIALTRGAGARKDLSQPFDRNV